MTEGALKERTARGLFWGGLSNGLVQVISILIGIVIARLLSPEEFGVIGVLTIFSAVATSLQESGFTAALINRKQVDGRDYNSVFWFNVLIGLTLYLILFFCAPAIARFFHNPDLVKLSRFAFLGFLIGSFGTAQTAYLTKKLQIKYIALSSIISVFLAGCVAVVLAMKGFSYWGIAIQNVTAVSINTLLLWLFSDWKPSLKWDPSPAAGMFGFSVKMMITNVFAIVGNYFFSVVFGRFYSERTVGLYNQANKWNAAGYSVINGMAASVAQPVLVEASGEKERQLRVLRKLIRFTAFVSFPLMFGLSLIAPEFIVIAVTEKWAESGLFLRILCLWGAFYPLTSVQVRFILSHGGSGIVMWSNIAVLLVQLAVCAAFFRLGITAMVVAYTVVNILWVFIWHHFVRRRIDYGYGAFLKDLLPYAGVSLAVMLITYFVTSPISNIYWLCGSRILIAALLYVAVMSLSGSVIFKESLQFLLTSMKRKH